MGSPGPGLEPLCPALAGRFLITVPPGKSYFSIINIITIFLLLSIFLKNLFIYFLFLAVLGLCCCVRAFSSCGEWGLLFVMVRRLLIAVASLVMEHGL